MIRARMLTNDATATTPAILSVPIRRIMSFTCSQSESTSAQTKPNAIAQPAMSTNASRSFIPATESSAAASPER